MSGTSRMVFGLTLVTAVAFGMSALAADTTTDKPAGKKKCQKHGRADIGAMFKKLDTNSDGAVTKDEFVAAREAAAGKRNRPAPAKDVLEKRFAKIDADTDGNLTLDEMKAAGAKMKAKHGKGKKHKGGKKNAAAKA